MDRVMVYDGALPQTTDILYTGKFGMVGQAYQNRAMLGTSTVVSGLKCLPTSPTPDLHVTVDVGSIYQMDPTDTAAFADLGVDNNSIMKQGILASPVSLTVTPPGTAGFSQVFLVQAILNDVDAGSTVLSYYNSANPASPFSGPNNSGTSNYTMRTCPCVVALKAGVAATTGTQTTPSPDAGYVGLYAITVANGATQVTSGNIVQLASAPFFPTLPAVPAGVLNGSWVYAGQDTGTANNYVITFGAGQAIPTAYIAGMGVKFKALNANSAASVVNVNGLGNVSIRRASGVAVATGDIVSGQMVELTYDGTNFQMQNYMGAGAGTNTTTAVSIPYVADSGTQNALVGTYSPAITSGQQVAGLALTIKLANTITGACTINVNGLGAKAVKTGDLANPPNGVYVAGEVLLLIYDGTQYQIANTSSLTYRKPTANTTIFVNGSTGSDTLYDGTASTVGSGTSGPLATIQKAVNTAFGYAPSQFTITISIAAGTYNENVSTPTFSGPNLIIDGNVTANVIVNGGSGSCIGVYGPNTMTVQNLTVQNNGVYPNLGIYASKGATMFTNTTKSNACSIPFYADAGASITVGSHIFNGSGYALFYGGQGGLVSMPPSAVYTIASAISVAQAVLFVAGSQMGITNQAPLPSFVNGGSCSGPKYYAALNGVINGNGLGTGWIAGTTAGSTVSGGQVAF